MKAALSDMVYQFGCYAVKDGRLVIHTGGISALESAFSALDMTDPTPCPELECAISGCHFQATCGGTFQIKPGVCVYLRTCVDHYTHAGKT